MINSWREERRTDIDTENILLVRVDRDEISSLNRKVVLVDREFEHGVNRRVYDCQSMTLSGSEGEIGEGSAAVPHVFPVDETVFRRLRPVRAFLEPDLVNGAVVVVCEEHLAEINVPIFDRGTVDHERAQGALTVLEGEVAVVPGWAVASTLDLVCEGTAGREGALGNAGDAVVAGVVRLNEAVPMDRCSGK